MNIPESWLRTFCDPKLSGRELSDKLTMSGLEVEQYEPLGPALHGAVVGEVLSVDKHPNADKLKVCKVRAGKEILTVVCGAPNVRAGMKAPLKTGAKEIRGVMSEGMLCSARDLGISDDHSGLLELNGPVGSDARKALGLDDRVFTLKLTPNRADALSILGVAREVSALTGATSDRPSLLPSSPRGGEENPTGLLEWEIPRGSGFNPNGITAFATRSTCTPVAGASGCVLAPRGVSVMPGGGGPTCDRSWLAGSWGATSAACSYRPGWHRGRGVSANTPRGPSRRRSRLRWAAAWPRPALGLKITQTVSLVTVAPPATEPGLRSLAIPRGASRRLQ